MVEVFGSKEPVIILEEPEVPKVVAGTYGSTGDTMHGTSSMPKTDEVGRGREAPDTGSVRPVLGEDGGGDPASYSICVYDIWVKGIP